METNVPKLILRPLEPRIFDGGEMRLELIAFAQHSIHLVPAYHFRMVDSRSGATAGKINLRLGWNDNLLHFAGHVGYAVDEAYRGQGFASRSLRLLKPLAARHGYKELWITCNPENFASRRSCEKAGAVFMDVVDVPAGSRLYELGVRQKYRYRLVVSSEREATDGDEIGLG